MDMAGLSGSRVCAWPKALVASTTTAAIMNIPMASSSNFFSHFPSQKQSFNVKIPNLIAVYLYYIVLMGCI